VEKHFRQTWARPETDFAETKSGTVFLLDPKIMRREQIEMEAFMLNKTNIIQAIKLRQDLGACRRGCFSHRIMKVAWTEGFTFSEIFASTRKRALSPATPAFHEFHFAFRSLQLLIKALKDE
jgi:hypothetical protein